MESCLVEKGVHSHERTCNPTTVRQHFASQSLWRFDAPNRITHENEETALWNQAAWGPSHGSAMFSRIPVTFKLLHLFFFNRTYCNSSNGLLAQKL